MQSLFDSNPKRLGDKIPLAERMRPRSFEEVLGQDSLVKKGAPFRTLVEQGHIPSCIFWGPPGTGKTTLAEVVAATTDSIFKRLSAVSAGVADIRGIVKDAQDELKLHGRRTILFIDEIHRFNKGQQDALLPHVEKGTIIFMGATTENPSFEVNQALLSRAKVFVLNPLDEDSVRSIIQSALDDKDRGLGSTKLKLESHAFEAMIKLANGDARMALNLLEMSFYSVPEKQGKRIITLEAVKSILQRTKLFYDKGGEEHYNIISALHKSLRGSDADAGLYWLARMLEGGEDPVYVARRLVRFAAEDVGMADPQAIVITVSVMQAVQLIGMPECNVHLAEAVVYLAKAKKSNALYTAYGAAAADARETSDQPVPLHLRNAPTKLMKELGYGKDYKYPPAIASTQALRAGNPNFKEPVDQEYLPDSLKGRKYYKPWPPLSS